MSLYVKDPIAFIRNFEFSKSAATPDESSIRRRLNIKICHAYTENDLSALMNENNYCTILLADSYALSAEAFADYLQDNKLILGIMPYASVSACKGLNNSEDVYLNIAVSADLNYDQLRISIMALIDRTVVILAGANTIVTSL